VRLFEAIRADPSLYETTRPFERMCLFQLIWAYPSLFEPIRACVSLSGTIRAYLSQFEPIPAYLSLPEPVRAYPRLEVTCQVLLEIKDTHCDRALR